MRTVCLLTKCYQSSIIYKFHHLQLEDECNLNKQLASLAVFTVVEYLEGAHRIDRTFSSILGIDTSGAMRDVDTRRMDCYQSYK
jgi:hypothetical protein